jgi:ABC-type lipoprotein export system ATPase subunit
LGKIGSGKSFLLNSLAGFKGKGEKNSPFEVAADKKPCTNECKVHEGNLYGGINKKFVKVKLIDTPGLYE